MSLWLSALAPVLALSGLPPKQLLQTGEDVNTAIIGELAGAHKMLRSVRDRLSRDPSELSGGFPRLHRALHADLVESGSLPRALYVGRADGTLQGVALESTSIVLWVGEPPKDPTIMCPDERVRSSCHRPPGVQPGHALTYVEDSADSSDWGLGNLRNNISFEPREQNWYVPTGTGHWTNVFAMHSLPPSLGITLSLPLSDGQGVVAVDLQLAGIDALLGPHRPAPGTEMVVLDVRDDTVVGSTLPAAERLLRMKGKPLSAFSPPFNTMTFSLARVFGGLKQVHRRGPVLFRAGDIAVALLHWDTVMSRPITYDGGLQWLLVVADDSENRAAGTSSASRASAAFAAALSAAAVLLF